MCVTCGCDSTNSVTINESSHQDSMTDQKKYIQIEQDILGKNNQLATANRDYFQQHNMFVLNLVSSPGSGKTSLLTHTLKALKKELPMAVIEGDQQTSHDADRIRATGIKAVQINTGKGCHLDASMIKNGLDHLQPKPNTLIFIENVGNLVCPASFDLGEAHKVVILSVTEGEDKPLKYPDMFYAADIMLLTKTDLLPYLDFDVEQCIEYVRRIKPDMKIFQLSARNNEGMDAWYNWLRQGHNKAGL